MNNDDSVSLEKRLTDLEWNVKRLLGREELAWQERPASEGLGPDVIEALESGNVLEAITRHRKNTGLGLAEAKAAVQAFTT